jgi:tRNA (cmo5U34)-methyltransferase
MNPSEITALFDRQAAHYDSQWEKTAPIQHCLYLLLDSLLADLPTDAAILCIGVGTGAELAHLARKNPGWRFTAVEPSGPMLDECRKRAGREGFAARCTFHQGYLESLPPGVSHDAATCFLVSQFILDHVERTKFFAAIARNLRPGGLLASSDLAADITSTEYDVLLHGWMKMMSAADITPEAVERMRKAYAHDVGVLPPVTIASLIKAAGFESPVQFFQAGLIHAWLSKRA